MPSKPSLKLKSVTFSDGTKIQLGECDIVVIVGPNNSGKSAALKEIESRLGTPKRGVVVKEAEVVKAGNNQLFADYLKENSTLISSYGSYYYVGYGYKIRHPADDAFGSSDRDSVRDFFTIRSATDDRLRGSNPAKTISYFSEKPEHPIHLLVVDRNLELRISSYFKQAFGADLIVFRAGGDSVPLLVGDRSNLGDRPDEFSREYLQIVKEVTEPLQRQGDGMRAMATVILDTLAVPNKSVVLLDEPEAFLHPPQARLLGEFLVEQRPSDSQLLIATHSPDILQGLLSVKEKSIRIVRLRRKGDINIAQELEPEMARAIADDPLTRFSGVYSGIFHKHIVICESDADCLFYNAILELPDVSLGTRPDVLFVHAGGKHRLHSLALTASKLGVPASVIVDIDVLNDATNFRRLFESMGGSWKDVEPNWRHIKSAVDQQRPKLTIPQLAASVSSIVEDLGKGTLGGEDFLQRVKTMFRTNSPWDMIKRAGRSALPQGEAIDHFDKIYKRCSSLGLWIVPVGELEGFCRSATSSKSGAWVESVFQRDLGQDPELAAARAFVKDLWLRAQAI